MLEIALIAGCDRSACRVPGEEVTPILEMSAAWIAVPLTVSMIVLATYAIGPAGSAIACFSRWERRCTRVASAAIVAGRYARAVPSTANVLLRRRSAGDGADRAGSPLR